MRVVTASVTLGALRYDSHVAALRLRRGLVPIVDRLDVTLPRGVRFEAVAGDDAVCDLDGGDGAETAFTGTVTAVRPTLHGTDVVCHGGAARLARHRPSLSLEQVTVGDVIARLCTDAGASTGDLEDGPALARYVATARSTALDEAARLLGLAGADGWFDSDDTLHSSAEPASEVALRYGRELVSARGSGAPEPGGDFVVVGEGAGDPGSAQGLWPIADFWAGGAPAAGPGVRLRAAHELRTTDDAGAAGAAWAARDAAARSPVRLRCWLLPALGPGTAITLAEVPGDLPVGTIRVRQVIHRIEPARAAVTDLWGHDEGAAGAGLGDLLGGLAGAVGGLL